MPQSNITWQSGSLNTQALKNKLNKYVEARSKFNDSSLPLLVDLINGILVTMNNLQFQINSGSHAVNVHTNLPAPPAHDVYWSDPT